MKTLRITTHWTAEQADCVYQLLGELQLIVWDHYGDEIAKMYDTIRVEQQQGEDNGDANHDPPF